MKETTTHSCARLVLAGALTVVTACGGSNGGASDGSDGSGASGTNGPTVEFADSAGFLAEAGGLAFISVELSGTAEHTVSIPFTVAGSATALADYTIAPSPLLVPPGETTAAIAITVLDDALHEALEVVLLTLEAPTGAQLGALTSHTASIGDDDPRPVVEFEVPDVTVGEADGPVVATLRLSEPSGLDVSVPFTVSGTATQDDVSITDGPIVIPAGATSAAITITQVDDLLDELLETVVLTLESPSDADLGAVIVHTTSIADDDAQPTVAFEFADQGVEESAEDATILVTLSAPSGLEVVVPYLVAGTATALVDFDVDLGPLVIPAGELAAELPLLVVDDALDELDETVAITLEAPTNAGLGAIVMHTVAILDDDAQPTVTFATPGQELGEASGDAIATVVLSAVSGLDVTVPFVAGGSATEGDDFTILASPLVIPAGESEAEITITPVNDALQEPTETIAISLESPTHADIGAVGVHTATIQDDDVSPVVGFVTTSESASEGAGVVVATLRLSALSGFDVSVPFDLLGTAESPGDYTTTQSPVFIPAGTMETSIVIVLAGDAVDEPDETAVIQVGAPTHALVGPSDSFTLTLVDDDEPPTVAFTTANQVAGEGAGLVTVEVALSSASGFEVSIPFGLGGTATQPGDFVVAPDPPWIVVPPGQVTGHVAVTLVDDALSELDETVELALGSPTHAQLGAVSEHVLTIEDDEDLRVSFAAPSQTAPEDAGSALVTLELSSVAAFDVSVPYSISGTATPVDDFSITPGPLEIAAGETSAVLPITIVGESLFEGPETIVITLGVPANAGLGANASHEVTIQDDDSPPTVAFAIATQDADEAQGAVSATLELSEVSGLDVVVPITLGGTALDLEDYVSSGGSMIIPAGQPSADFGVALVSDDLDEPAETIVMDIGQGVTGADLGALLQHTITLADDDASPAVEFATESQNAPEAGSTALITVQLSAASGWDVAVPLTISGSAEDQVDFVLSGSTIAIPAGALSGTETLTVLDDPLDESNETIEVALGTPLHADIGDVALHTVTILDDDSAPTVSFLSASAAIGEPDGWASFTIQLSAVSGQEVVVPYTVTGTASQPDDYSVAAGPFVVQPGEAIASIDVSIVDDGVGEEDESVILTLGAPTNADLGVLVQSELEILDDDPPAVEFVASAQSTAEGTPAIAIVRLSKVATQDVTVPFSVSGTADDPADYTMSSSPLTILAGQQAGILDFTLVGDTTYEPDETVVVMLGAPVNGTLGGQASHTLTILDDDAPPTVQFTSPAQTTVEPNAYLVVATVELSEPSGTDLTVHYTIAGTAQSPEDYSIQQSPITILAGSTTANIAVAMVDDTLGEPDESIELTLVAPLGSAVGPIGVHTITIFDNDGGPGPSLDLVLEPAAWTMFVGETVNLTAIGAQPGDVVWRIEEVLAGDFRDTGNATTHANPAQFVGGRYAGEWRVTATSRETGAEASMTVTLLPLEFTFHETRVDDRPRAALRRPAWARHALQTSRALDALPLVAVDPKGLATGPIVHVVLPGPDGALLTLDDAGLPIGLSPIAPYVDLSAMQAMAIDPAGGIVLAGEHALVHVHGGETEMWIPEVPVVGIQDISVGMRGAIWVAALEDGDRATGSIRVLNALGREIAVIREFEAGGSLHALRRPVAIAIGPEGTIHIFEETFGGRTGSGAQGRPGLHRIVADPVPRARD